MIRRVADFDLGVVRAHVGDNEERALSTTVDKPVSQPPVRLSGTVRQWSGTVGSVEPDNQSGILLVSRADVADGLELEIGSRVSFQPDGRRAVAVWEAQESED